jgi:hypothetical protein
MRNPLAVHSKLNLSNGGLESVGWAIELKGRREGMLVASALRRSARG